MQRSPHLATLLAAFHPPDPTQRAFLDAMLELNRAGERSFSRDCFDPGHFTASAFILDATQERLLLILHGKLKMWLQPGGHIDAGDHDVIAAARREILEEVGLATVELAHDGIFDVDIHNIPALGSHPPHQHFDVRFLFVSPSDAVTAATDAQAAKWVPLDEVASIQSDASVMRAVRQIQAR